ncbi:MAG: BtaA family protein [Flavobacteriales bacterium]|nr:BtaA family protein [Flavobacteriales bacterium]
MASITKRADFNFLRYANVWEDADVLMHALGGAPDRKFLSIASAGDNSLSLLTLDPSLVVAVDVSPIQLALTELKAVAIKTLSREECMAFLGFRASEKREQTYQHLRGALSPPAQELFDAHIPSIESGIVHRGKFEEYFRIFSSTVLPLIHRKKTVRQLLEEKSAEDQERFYNERWHNRRWEWLFRIFFSKWVMGRLGRDPEFMKEVDISVNRFILDQAKQHLSTPACQHNGMLRYQLTGNFGHELPHYLQEANYANIQARIDRLKFYQGYAEDAISEFGTFHGMNLSNIFEYMPLPVFESSAKALSDGLSEGGKLCYWNLMVTRHVHRIVDSIEYDEATTNAQRKVDKGFFYKGVVIEQKKNEH